MEMMNQIKIDQNKCIHCGRCKLACPSMLLDVDAQGKVFSKPVEKLNWYGCWKCEHCMAVCPTGAISVMGKDPADSMPMANDDMTVAATMDSLVAGRRSCRHYKQENVDPALIDHILQVLQNAPTGGNKMMVEYTLIDNIETMNKLRKLLDAGTKELLAKEIYMPTWDKESMDIMASRGEQAMNGDMYFCSAPHYFIPHMPAKSGSVAVDVTITLAYFELLCNAHGLGTVYLGFPKNLLNLLPEVKKLLQIPEDHIIGSTMGFGYPMFDYARGSQKDGVKIHKVVITD